MPPVGKDNIDAAAVAEDISEPAVLVDALGLFVWDDVPKAATPGDVLEFTVSVGLLVPVPLEDAPESTLKAILLEDLKAIVKEDILKAAVPEHKLELGIPNVTLRLASLKVAL
ncbi:MAG: hypothetical protein M1827_001935 [Pycnora praestabilis]|nr:MAG: hypothetical protein M1827_001935 [Pycnora praestabilis]